MRCWRGKGDIGRGSRGMGRVRGCCRGLWGAVGRVLEVVWTGGVGGYDR